MAKKAVKVYTYKRVSTTMQIDGFSLDAQDESVKRYAKAYDYQIVGEYCDEGKSGKNIEDRLDFKRMLNDIANKKDDITYVLVFKLSRFGRNAADVLNSLQFMQDYNVNLICVEDGIDSSKDGGKLMISVLSAVAEIERDNILVQTMAGRKQKAREGKWNGGFAPYGYKLVNGELQIEEDEAEAVRIIFDKFVNTTMGYTGVVKYLEQKGIKKKARQNGYLTQFAVSTVKAILDNPIYCGKIAFGRRKTEKIEGTRNKFHVVKQNEYDVYDGIHEAIISEELFNLAQAKRKATAGKLEKKHSLDHEHILSGLVKCPVCGAGLVGNVNRKKKPDGTYYKDYFTYACKHRLSVDGHKCDWHRQLNQEVVNEAVADVIKKLVDNPRFAEVIKTKIDMRIDTKEAEADLENAKKQLKQLIGTKDKIAMQIDNLDVLDRNYDRKFDDLQARLDVIYDKIADVEETVASFQTRLINLTKDKITGDNVYKYLLLFGKLYDKFTDMEKKTFYNSFIKDIQIYEDDKETGQILKKIGFKLPVFYNGEEVMEICWDKQTTVETVCLLGNRKQDTHVELSIDMKEYHETVDSKF